MPWYRVAYVPAVLNDLRTVDRSLAQRLLNKTKWLASNAANLRQESLHPDLPDLVQYAVANWRILYTIDREEHIVAIHRITTRQELYRRASSS